MKTIVLYEGQKNTIQGECKPREAMEILGLNPKEWKVTAKDITGKAWTYTIVRVSSLVPVSSPEPKPQPESNLTMTDALTGETVKGPSVPIGEKEPAPNYPRW